MDHLVPGQPVGGAQDCGAHYLQVLCQVSSYILLCVGDVCYLELSSASQGWEREPDRWVSDRPVTGYFQLLLLSRRILKSLAI